MARKLGLQLRPVCLQAVKFVLDNGRHMHTVRDRKLYSIRLLESLYLFIFELDDGAQTFHDLVALGDVFWWPR